MSGPLAIGLDIGGTNARAALVQRDADETRILAQTSARIREDTSPQHIASTIGELVEQCCARADVTREQLVGVGVGIAGQLSSDHRVVINGPNLGWRDVPFAQLVEAEVGLEVPTHVFNDLSVITWGEQRCGGGRGCDDLVVVFVGTGVGCGLVLGGSLYEGSGAKAGEIGHSKVIAAGGRACGCGELGCLETLIGGRYLELRAVADLNAGDAEDLREFLSLPRAPLAPASVLPSDLDRAASEGVAYAASLWREATTAFGVVMSACLALINPSGWLLGGGVMAACPTLRQNAIARTAERTVAAIWKDLEVLEPTLGEQAGLLGAALLSMEASGGGRHARDC